MYQNWKKYRKLNTVEEFSFFQIMQMKNICRKNSHMDFFFFKGRLRGAEGKWMDLCICSGCYAFGFSFFLNFSAWNWPPLCYLWFHKCQPKSLDQLHAQLAQNHLIALWQLAAVKTLQNSGSCKRKQITRKTAFKTTLVWTSESFESFLGDLYF